MRKVLFCLIFFCSTIICQAQFNPLNPFKMTDYKVSKEDKMTLALYDDIVIPDHIDPTVAYAYVLIFEAKLNEIDSMIEFKTNAAYAEDDFDFLAELNNDVIELRKLRKEVKIYHDFYESVNVLTGSPEWRRSFFPIRTHAQTEFYYSKIKDRNFQFLSNVVIQGGEDKAVVVSDMVTGYLGVFRCNINTVFYSSADQDSAEVLVDKIFNGGGLLNANISYPLFFRLWNHAAVTVDLNLKGASDFSAFGSTLPKDQFIGYLEPSCNIYGELALRNTSTSLFLNLKIGGIFASDALNEQIGNTSGNPFSISQIYAGINLDKRIKISANIPLQNIQGLGGAQNFTMGVQFFPEI